MTPYVARQSSKTLIQRSACLTCALWAWRNGSSLENPLGRKRPCSTFSRTRRRLNCLFPTTTTRQDVVGNHPWEAIIYDIWVEADYNFPQSTHAIDPDTGELRVVTAPTLYIRALMADPAYKGSSFITRKYLSAVQPETPSDYHLTLEALWLKSAAPDESLSRPITMTFSFLLQPSGTHAAIRRPAFAPWRVQLPPCSFEPRSRRPADLSC